MAFFKRKPAPLTKIKANTTAEFSPNFKPQPDAKALMKPDQTPAEYLSALEGEKQTMDGANMLAHEMPERDSVWWACESSNKVSDKLNAADTEALTAAQEWVKNPTPENQAAAAAAASGTDLKGPGGWAAQAAAWSKPEGGAGLAKTAAVEAPAVAGAAPAQEPSGLVGAAVAGSVLLAAGLMNQPAMPEAEKPKLEVPTEPPEVPENPALDPQPPPEVEVPPVDQSKLAKNMKPFMELGKEIAAGKNSWA